MASLKERLVNRSATYQSNETQKETERQLVVLEISGQVWNELVGVFENLTEQELCGMVVISLRIDSANELSYTVTTEESGTVHKITIPHACTVDDVKEALGQVFDSAKAESIETRRCGYVWQFIYAPPADEDEMMVMETSPSFPVVADDNFIQKLQELKLRYEEVDKSAIGIVNAVGYDDLEELKKKLKKVNTDTKMEEKSERERLSNTIGAYNAKRSGDLDSILQEFFALAESIIK